MILIVSLGILALTFRSIERTFRTITNYTYTQPNPDYYPLLSSPFETTPIDETGHTTSVIYSEEHLALKVLVAIGKIPH